MQTEDNILSTERADKEIYIKWALTEEVEEHAETLQEAGDDGHRLDKDNTGSCCAHPNKLWYP